MIDATVVLAHRRGAQSLTLAAAADEAGLSREIAREAFETEHELLVATLGSLVDEWTRLTEPEPGADPVEALRTSVRVISQPRSSFSTTWSGSTGRSKLGQPVPLSNLWTLAKSGSPETMST